MTMTAIVKPHLPYLRRYARALTGSQVSGDAYVRILLEALAEGDLVLAPELPPQIALYRLFHELWSTNGHPPDDDQFSGNATVEQRLQALPPENREALLLTTVEGFSIEEAAQILDCTGEEIVDSISATLVTIGHDLESRVLIVEDEAMIALDLKALVNELGHTVVGIATTRDDAIRMARQHRPELVLTDIKLADGSSGVDAAVGILKMFDVPVIFITAYPEYLLTGERPEPTYFLTKPFSREAVRAVIGQVLFFHKPKVAA
jgi:DNA-directed RNA polymerase specialized sigma24 family protein/CheY-like chemotaxis protein